MTKTFHFKALLQNDGWLQNAVVSTDKNGIITNISSAENRESSFLNCYTVPGFQNVHSHAFQYAMAGLAERQSENSDDFWGWREAMYQLALSVNPEQMEAIATMLYSEMLRHGYTHVAEFHYLHHDKNGTPYTHLAEMGNRLVSAAQAVGIGITLIPIFYQKGGFGKAPNERQKRFISPTIDDYFSLFEASKDACKIYNRANVAVGIHSMRGVEPTDILKVIAQFPTDIPFHIHISEQLKEVEDCLKYLGKRPVEWLLENANLNERFHLVHATHLTEKEIIGLANSNANVVLCPSTEGNLGDGLFPLKKFQEKGGKWSIGTDSHIGLNPLEELRILDYGQRLASHKRSTFFSPDQSDGGMYAMEMATTSGRKAMNNFSNQFFKIGEPFNACLMDASAPLLANCSLENVASTIVYASDISMQWGTISQGKLMVKEGKHIDNQNFREKFNKVMTELRNR